jgi:glutamyl-tRNA synthetase
VLERSLVDSLFDAELPDPRHWEERFGARSLPADALVTRFAPSPTGSLHIGGVYTAMISKDVARHSGGTYFVRVEDTDQSRQVAGADEQFARAFAYFGIEPDPGNEPWGPLRQSHRRDIYLSYIRQLIRHGQAYPCFCSRDELAEITSQQRAAGVPTGYYGRWARWRDETQERVVEALQAGRPWVVRFRAPADAPARVRYTDRIRGDLDQENNRNDVVVLKSSDQRLRLPTYHLAHVVDDHLMRVSLVLRGEEWISSVPVHLQLFDALGFAPIDYAHIAPLMKQQGASKRKLSKRHDPEASVDYYLEVGYPAPALLYYLRGLANGRLAELPLAEALAEPIRLQECGTSGPQLDVAKLDDISRDHIATISGAEVLAQVIDWARRHDPELADVLARHLELARRAIDVERVGVDNPRKDLARWADFRAGYGFFFPELFAPVTDADDPRLGGLEAALVRALVEGFAAVYTEHTDATAWFAQVRDLAARHGFAADTKTYKKDPGAYPGSIREAANVIRVALTGSRRSPGLHEVAMAIGAPEVQRRLLALTG